MSNSLRKVNQIIHNDFSEESFKYEPSKELQSLLSPLLINSDPVTKCFQFHWLTPEYISYLFTRIEETPFKKNDFEQEDIDTPQIRLEDRNPELFLELYKKFFVEIAGICEVLIGLPIININSILFADYSSDDFKLDAFHTDDAGNVSVAVALNDDYEGGGFEIYQGGAFGSYASFPKPSAGLATVFPGKAQFHRSRETTKGHRYILVFWCESYEPEIIEEELLEHRDNSEYPEVKEYIDFILDKEKTKKSAIDFIENFPV